MQTSWSFSRQRLCRWSGAPVSRGLRNFRWKQRCEKKLDEINSDVHSGRSIAASDAQSPGIFKDAPSQTFKTTETMHYISSERRNVSKVIGKTCIRVCSFPPRSFLHASQWTNVPLSSHALVVATSGWGSLIWYVLVSQGWIVNAAWSYFHCLVQLGDAAHFRFQRFSRILVRKAQTLIFQHAEPVPSLISPLSLTVFLAAVIY